MEAILYSEAKNNLKKLIDEVCENFEEFVITTKDKKSAVLISLDEYNSLKETIYLLSSKKNKERLLEAVEEVEKAAFLRKDIEL